MVSADCVARESLLTQASELSSLLYILLTAVVISYYVWSNETE